MLFSPGLSRPFRFGRLPLAYLAPDIVEAILLGQQPMASRVRSGAGPGKTSSARAKTLELSCSSAIRPTSPCAASPSRTRATKRRRSSITETSFHGINTSGQITKSVTHVSGTMCYRCLKSDTELTYPLSSGSWSGRPGMFAIAPSSSTWKPSGGGETTTTLSAKFLRTAKASSSIVGSLN